MFVFYQIQPSPLAFSRSGCEADIGDRVQGGEEQLREFLCHLIWACSFSWPNLTSAVSRHLPGNFSVLLWPFQFYIGESGVLPFLLLLPLLMVSGHLHLPSLRFLHPVTIFISSTFTSYTRSTSLLTAALMLCGVDQAKVALLTRWTHDNDDKEAIWGWYGNMMRWWWWCKMITTTKRWQKFTF